VKKKLEVKFSVRIKDCPEVFMEGEKPGVVGVQEVVYKDVPAEGELGYNMFMRQVWNHKEKMIDEFVEVDIEEIE
jgi:hypothetical protein